MVAAAGVLFGTVSLTSQSAPPPPPPSLPTLPPNVRIHLNPKPRPPRRLADLTLEGLALLAERAANP